MMTLTQAERLVRKIVELLGQPALEAQAAKLAQDYAELGHAANHRLEQCAAMIEAGEDLQALQLAETRPPLLDLITILSFRQAGEWRNYCQTHGLQWVEPFYDKFVRLLNSTYGKGIASDHPFYRDYRRAVMKNDDERALSILRVIARLNPADQNAAQELQRLEAQALRSKLDGLHQILDAGDPAAVLAELAQLEASALPIPPTHPAWQQAQLVRCQHLLRQAQSLREREAWEEAELVVEEIRALATQHEVSLPPADTETWNALETWTAGKRAAFAEDQDFQHALEALEYQVQTSETKRGEARSATLAELQSEFNSLANKWREAEHFGRPLDEELLTRCQQNCDWLQSRIQGRLKRKRVTAVIATLVGMAAVAAVGFRLWDSAQEKQFLVQFGTLVSARRVGDTERLLARVPARLKLKPRLADAITKAQEFVSREMEPKRVFDQKYGALHSLAAQGFPNALGQVEARRAECDQALTRLAPEFQPGGKSNLIAFDEQWQSQLQARQPEHNAEFSTRLIQAERMAADRLNGTNGFAAVRAALPRLQTLLVEMDRLRIQPVPLDEVLAHRFREFTNQVSSWARVTDQWEKLHAALPESHSLEEYRECLHQLSQSPFATLALREIDQRNISQAALLGALLLPGQPQAWDSLTNLAAPRVSFRPDEPTPREKAAYLKLRDDVNIQEVYWFFLTKHPHPDNPLESHAVLTRGLLGTNKFGQLTGKLYDPKKYPGILRFEQQSINDWDYKEVEKKGLSKESDAFQRLGLHELINPNTGNYQKSILELLDQLNQDTDSSAIFRAFVTLRLFEIADQRPMEWGLQWTPTASIHLEKLKDLGGQNLHSGDWMVPHQFTLYERPFQKYFEQARGVSLDKQARFYQRLTRRTCETGFAFAGFVDAQGSPVVMQTNAIRGEYWGWSSRSGLPALLLRRTDGTEAWQKLDEPLRFTPLFVFLGDRGRVLEEAAKVTLYPLREAGAILPPFFTGAL